MPTAAKVAIGVVGGVIALAVVLIAAVTLLGTNASTRFEQVGQSIGGSPTTGDTSPDDELAVPDGFTAFEDPDGAFALALPKGWVTVSLDAADLENAGAQYSNDPKVAEAIDAAIAAAAGNVLFFAIDGGDTNDAFVANLNVLSFPAGGVADTGSLLEQIDSFVRPQLESLGVTGFRAQGYSGSSLLGAEVSYAAPPGTNASAEGLQYYLVDGGTVWVLTFTTDHLQDDRASFEQVAATFEPR
jgi:Flp pilus assembly pilin Flp